jgi:transposase-like protein
MKRISGEEKEKILEESYEEGCTVSEIGRKYKMSAKTIYGWRRNGRKQGKDKIC